MPIIVEVSQTHNIESKGRDGKKYPYMETIKLTKTVESESDAPQAYIDLTDGIFQSRMEKFDRIKKSGNASGGSTDKGAGFDNMPNF